MHDFAALRQRLVDNQIRPSEVTDHALIKAFLSTPRELFVEPAERPFAYSDRELRYAADVPGRRMIDPVQLARLIQMLPIGSRSKVLVVGCGTGYSAAILAGIAGEVVALEENDRLAATATELLPSVGAGNVAVVRGKLAEGYPAAAPYDAVLVEGSVEMMPGSLLAQLGAGGALSVIEKSDRISRAMLYERVGDGSAKWPQFEAWAAPLPGFEAKREFVF